MTSPDRKTVRVTDLRGAGGPPPSAVLADPSGRRAARLHRVGRVAGVLLLLWFVCLVLAGLGLLPASGVPFAGTLGPTAQPQRLDRIPPPKPTSRGDLRPAVSLADSTSAAPGSGGASGTANGPTTPPRAGGGSKGSGKNGTVTTSPGQSGTAPGQTTTTPGQSGTAPGQTATTPGKSQSAPGQTATTPGKSGSAPGQTTTAPGNSGTAPGHSGAGTSTTTTTPGSSGSAPGQTRTDTTGHGPPR